MTTAPPIATMPSDVGEVEMVVGTGKDILDKDIARSDGEEEMQSNFQF